MDNKTTKPEEIEQEALSLEELDKITGGAGLRTAPKTETSQISDDTRSKI